MVLNIISEEDIVNQLSVFRRNFNALHPQSHELLLFAKNEHEEKKSIMSYITPALIPYQNFVDFRADVTTLSNLIRILPSAANELPTMLQSPTKVMEVQESSIIEATFTLASILLGCGYQAFVVQGEAVKDKVTNDCRNKNCPYQLPTDEVTIEVEEKAFNKYRVKAPIKLESTFKLKKKTPLINGSLNQSQEAGIQDGSIVSVEATDVETTLCFWVMISSFKEDETNSFYFANIADGALYEAKNCNFIFKRIHSVFNNENFWACKYFNRKVNKLNFDLTDSDCWYPFLNPNLEKCSVISDRWTRPLVISEEVIQLEYPAGKRREEYRDAVAEKFAPFVHERGIVLFVTRTNQNNGYSYKDEDWKCFELYKHRQDCLERRSENFAGEISECFFKSRSDTLKGHRYTKKESNQPTKGDDTKEDSKETIPGPLGDLFSDEYFEFYNQFRADNLKSRHLYLATPEVSAKLDDAVAKDEETKLKRRWKASLNIVKKKSGLQEIEREVETEAAEKENTLTVEPLLEGKPKGATTPTEDAPSNEGEEKKLTPPPPPPPKISFDLRRSDIMDFIQKLGKDKSKKKKVKISVSDERKVILMERYENRDDFLRERKVTFKSAEVFSKGRKHSSDSIEEIKEEFECPTSVAHPEILIQKRMFSSTRKECVLIYHYGKNRLLQGSHLFDIPKDHRISSLTYDMVKSFNPDLKLTMPSLEELRLLLGKQLEEKSRIEREILKAVEEMKQVKERRRTEEENIVLTSGLFHFNHNPLLKQLMEQEKEKESKREEEEKKRREEKEGKVDTISPYLPLLTVLRSSLQAQTSLALDNCFKTVYPDIDKVNDNFTIREQIKERCLEDLMKRLELRANLLQDRLDKAKNEILFYREELGGRKRRPSPEERALLTEKLTKAEAEHRRLRGFLVNWRSEAAHRYELLEAALETEFVVSDVAA